jgi:hypothetical protein
MEPKGVELLRYVTIRLRPTTSRLFSDGSSVFTFAVLSNTWIGALGVIANNVLTALKRLALPADLLGPPESGVPELPQGLGRLD